MSLKQNQTRPNLPVGRAARLACEVEALRIECCAAAELICQRTSPDEIELEECAQLDDAMDQAQKILKSAVARIILSRLKRRSRVG